MKDLLKTAMLSAVVLLCGTAVNAQHGLNPLKITAISLPPAAKVLPLSIRSARLVAIEEASALPVSCAPIATNCSVVAVQLLDFSALRVNDETAALTWHTEAEAGLNGYYIERSVTRASAFTGKGFTAASSSAALRKEYHFNDPNTLTVTSYYRLKISHADGSFTFSDVVPVRPVKELSALHVYPSPASSMLNIRVSVPKNTAAVITWNDATGKKVREQNRLLQAGTNNFTEDISALADGSYFITVSMPDAAKMVTTFFKVKG